MLTWKDIHSILSESKASFRKIYVILLCISTCRHKFIHVCTEKNLKADIAKCKQWISLHVWISSDFTLFFIWGIFIFNISFIRWKCITHVTIFIEHDLLIWKAEMVTLLTYIIWFLMQLKNCPQYVSFFLLWSVCSQILQIYLVFFLSCRI